MTRYKGIQVSERDLRIMKYLLENKSSYPKKVADELGLTVSFAFHHLRELEKQKIVKKGERGKNIPYELTKLGEALSWYLNLSTEEKILVYGKHSK